MKSICNSTKITKTLTSILLLMLLLPNIILAQGLGKRLNRGFEPDDIEQQQLKAKINKRANAGFGGGIQMRVWARALKLTNEQLKRMRQTMRIAAENYISIEKQAIQKRQELERATFSENFNEESVKQMALDLAKLEGQIIVMRTKVQIQIRGILTSEQLKLYNELRFGAGFAKDVEQGTETEKPTTEKPETEKN